MHAAITYTRMRAHEDFHAPHGKRAFRSFRSFHRHEKAERPGLQVVPELEVVPQGLPARRIAAGRLPHWATALDPGGAVVFVEVSEQAGGKWRETFRV